MAPKSIVTFIEIDAYKGETHIAIGRLPFNENGTPALLEHQVFDVEHYKLRSTASGDRIDRAIRWHFPDEKPTVMTWPHRHLTQYWRPATPAITGE